VTGRSLVQSSLTECDVSVCMCVYVPLCGITCNNNPVHLQLVGRIGQTKKERKKDYKLCGCYVTLLYSNLLLQGLMGINLIHLSYFIFVKQKKTIRVSELSEKKLRIKVLGDNGGVGKD
jgi:hypothetical protein